MFTSFGTAADDSKEDVDFYVKLGDKIVADFVKLKAARDLTEAEQQVYDTFLEASKKVDEPAVIAQLSGYNNFGHFGRNWFTPVVHTVKKTAVVARSPITVVRMIKQGNVKGAGKLLLDNANPIVAAAKIATNDPRKLNYARLTFPTSVVNITDKKLRKKAAIGYAAAAVVAGAAFAATAVTIGQSGMTAAELYAAGASPLEIMGASSTVGFLTGAGAAAGTAASTAKTGMALVSTAKSLVGGESKERSGVSVGPDRYETERPVGIMQQISELPLTVKIPVGIAIASLTGALILKLVRR